MNSIRVFAIVLIVVGGLGLVYGGFSYTRETQQAKLGSIELLVKDTENVNIPVWVSAGAILVGVILAFSRNK